MGEAKGTKGEGGRKRRRQSIHRSASSPGVGRLSLRAAPLPRSPPIIIIFYHNICFSHILFYVNGRSLLLPAPPASLSPPLAAPPISSRRPSLRMHGLGELLAFCLEFKKFFHLSPAASSPRRVAPHSPPPRHRLPSRRATLVVVVTYLFRFVSCTPTCCPTLGSVS